MALVALLAGFTGAAAAIAGAYAIGLTRGTPAAVERRLAPAIQSSTAEGGSIVEIAIRARPWVVNVNTRGRSQGVFGARITQGTGSGVILRSDGHIVTNAHVVTGAQEIEVTFASGESATARIVGIDPDTDLAVLKVDRTDLPSAVIGSAKDLQVGELAVAIGSPLGLEQSVTSGIISALGRRVDREEAQPLLDMIQTDAPITQGNSGGALIDGKGALVGINTAIAASPEVGAEGIAFAIPVDIAKSIADQLIATGRATHPWIGISGGNIDAETARLFGIESGALVGDVLAGGPADTAGIRPRDVIVSFDGESITSMDELIVEIRSKAVGERVTVEVVRGSERLQLELVLGDRPSNP
jgi:serine protease DegQ